MHAAATYGHWRVVHYLLEAWGRPIGGRPIWLWVNTNGTILGWVTTHFSTYFSGDWDVHWGYDLDCDPGPYMARNHLIFCSLSFYGWMWFTCNMAASAAGREIPENGLGCGFCGFRQFFTLVFLFNIYIYNIFVLFQYSTGVDPQKPHPKRRGVVLKGSLQDWTPFGMAHPSLGPGRRREGSRQLRGADTHASGVRRRLPCRPA